MAFLCFFLRNHTARTGKNGSEEIIRALAEIDCDGGLTFGADPLAETVPTEMMPKALAFLAELGRYRNERFNFYHA